MWETAMKTAEFWGHQAAETAGKYQTSGYKDGGGEGEWFYHFILHSPWVSIKLRMQKFQLLWNKHVIQWLLDECMRELKWVGTGRG